MSDHKFDRLLSEIRNEPVDEQVVSQAAKRVWSSIAGPPTAELSMHKLRSCEDFQTLIPEYLGRNLPEARRLLFEDHVHQCVACRHAVEQARNGELQPVWQPVWRTTTAAGGFPPRGVVSGGTPVIVGGGAAPPVLRARF